jgi:hypothetical protein
MNTFRKPSLAKRCLESLLLLAAAALLLRASWLPVIEIKGFDTFALESVAMWATRAARVTLIAVILCLLVRPLALARWWMALSVGILIGPLADMAVRTVDLVEMMKSSGQGDMSELIVIKTGTWVCAAGLACWLLDIAAATIGIVRGWRGK